MIVFLPLYILAFAFFYRARGGFVSMPDTNLARLSFWAFPVCLVFLNLICGLLAWVGLLIPHARFQNATGAVDFIGMSCVGFARLALILIPVMLADAPHVRWELLLLALVGGLQGCAYWVGWKLLDGHVVRFPGTDHDFAHEGAEWGEVLTGAIFGVAFFAATFV